MLEIAGGIILAVFGLIAIVAVLCLVARAVGAIQEWNPRPRKSIPPSIWKIAPQDRIWLALGIGMVVVCGIIGAALSR